MLLASLDLTQLLTSAGLAGVLVWVLISFQLAEYRRMVGRLTQLEDQRAQMIASQIQAQERSAYAQERGAQAISDLTRALLKQSYKIGELVETLRHRPCLYDGPYSGRPTNGGDGCGPSRMSAHSPPGPEENKT